MLSYASNLAFTSFCHCVYRGAPHSARILGRRYALTPTSYKYLDIGIRAGAASCVELVLGDNRGNRISLSTAIWKELLGKRAAIENLLQAAGTSPLWIRDLSIANVQIRGDTVAKIVLGDTSIYLKPATMLCLLDLEYCVAYMYSWLCDNTHLVDAKFTEFVNVLRREDVTDVDRATQVLYSSQAFKQDSLIDCELVVYAVRHILYAACNA